MRKILCPVDFSEDSRRALEYAAALAGRRELELTVLYVSADGEGEEELQTFVAATRNARGAIQVVSVPGAPVRGILDQAAALQSDLIIMGTRGRSGLARVLLGSVAERVLRESRLPVITIPPALGGAAQPAGEPWGPILCPSDFSPSCRKALGFALWAAQEEHARLILLNAVAWPANIVAAEPLPVLTDALPTRTELEQSAYKRLIAALPDDEAVQSRTSVVIAIGDPSDAILRVAADDNVQLIVMGIQSRSTADLTVFGSTTRRVIQAARCAVMSIRAEEHEESWPVPNDGDDSVEG